MMRTRNGKPFLPEEETISEARVPPAARKSPILNPSDWETSTYATNMTHVRRGTVLSHCSSRATSRCSDASPLRSACDATQRPRPVEHSRMNTTRTSLTRISPAESLPSLARAKSIALAFLATLGLIVLAACDADSSSSVTTGFDQSELRLTPAQLQIDNHSKATLDLRRIFSDGRSVPASGTVTWMSSSPAVATVSASGEVTARLPGEVTITARTDRGSATARIEILPTNQDLRLVVDDSIQVQAGADGAPVLTARIVDVTGRPVPGLQVDFGVLEGEGASIHPARAFTDTDGFARATVTAGTAVAEVQAEATSPGIVRASAAQGGDEAAPFINALRRLIRIIVNPSFPASVQVTPGSVAIDAGSSATLSALVRDSYGNAISDATLQWRSSDSQRAPINGSGQVTGVSATTAEVTATATDGSGRSASGTAQVEIRGAQPPPSPPSLGSIAVAGGNNQAATVGGNLASALAVRALDTQGNPLSGVPVQWEVTQGSATLGSGGSTTASTGLATTTVRLGTQAGQVRVRATASGVNPVTFTVTANPGSPAAVEVTPASATVAAGETLNLQASARDQHGNALSSATFTWSSSNTEVATVNSSGRITARAAGSADIRAQAGSATGSAAITVPSSTPSNPSDPTPPTTPSEPGQVVDLQVVSATATSLTLRFTEVNDGTGNSALYNIRFRNEATFGNWGTAQAVSSGSCTATMGSPLAGQSVGTVRTCTVTGLSTGTDYTFRMVAFRRDGSENVFGALSNIGSGSTASSSDGSGNGNGNGNDGSAGNDSTATTLRISAPTTSLTSLGQTVQLGVEALNAGGSAVSTPSVSWTSSNNSVATVNSSGRVIANAIGTAVISVAAACCSADQVTIEVSQQVASVEVTPGSSSLVPGQTRQFSAVARDANGNAVPGVGFAWTSTNTSVANVNGSGFASALGSGSTTIRASASGRVGTADLSVSGPQSPPPGGADSEFRNAPQGFSVVRDSNWSSLSGWGHANRSGQARIASLGGRSVLEMLYPQGMPDGSDPGVVATGLNGQEVFFGTTMLFDNHFVQHNLGIKLHLLSTNAGGWIWINENRTHRPGQVGGNVAPGFGIGIKGSGSPTNIDFIGGDNLRHNAGAAPQVGLGEWVKLEVYVRINDPGTSNGIVRFWINDVLVTEYTNIRWGSSVTRLGGFQHAGTWGGGGSAVPHAQSWYVDRTFVSQR